MNLPELFKLYLKAQKVSVVTAKNYLADVNHFFRWLAGKTGITPEVAGKGILGLFTQETISEYKSDQSMTNTPHSTINRRLSALRKFGEFCVAQGWLLKNEAILVTNSPPLACSFVSHETILAHFKLHLENKKVSRVTVKNYLSDIKHFLEWLK